MIADVVLSPRLSQIAGTRRSRRSTAPPQGEPPSEGRVLRRLLYQRRYAAQLAAVIRGNHGRLPSTSISTVTCRMTAPELKPDEPDWLAPPLALPPLVRDGTSRLAGCVPVSDIEWRWPKSSSKTKRSSSRDSDGAGTRALKPFLSSPV